MTWNKRNRAKNLSWEYYGKSITDNIKFIAKHLSWMNYVKFICVIVAILLIVALVIKMVWPNALPKITEIKPETILLALAIALLLPYISNIEALGVKIETREQVKELSAWVNASSYYPLAVDYQGEGDAFLAEIYYRKCLEICDSFWPALFRLGTLYDEKDESEKNLDDYSAAIYYYNKVNEFDKDNFYAYYNLATVYLNAPPPIRNPQKALEFAEKMLEIIPSYADALYFKGEALNYLHRYQEAFKILDIIINDNLMKDRYWALYELTIAKSNLENQLTQDDLDKIYKAAEDIGEAENFLDSLSKGDTQEQFISHQGLIKEFLTKKEIKLDVT